MPPMTTVARGRCTSAPVPVAIAIGTKPSEATKAWAAAGLVDTDLSFLSLLELYGTEISERRMPTRRVVEALDVVEHI